MRGKKVLKEVSMSTDGSFEFDIDLRVRRTYRLQITIHFSDRVYPERVTVFFKVRKIPKGMDTDKVTCRTVHQIQERFKRWKTIDKEKITCVVEGATLWFQGAGAIVFNTFALELPWLSQHLSPDRGRNPATLRYHTFTYDGKQFRIPLHHLCLSTCVASCLQYYDIKVGRNLIRIQDVAEVATRWFLDMQAGKHKQLPGFNKKLDKTQPDIVRFTDGSYPHNLDPFVLQGVKELLGSQSSPRTLLHKADTDNLMTTNWPNLKIFLGAGWPTIIADDQKGNWEHARICRGLVINHSGKITHAYVNDPWRESRLRIKTNGSASDLGWVLVSLSLPQGHISPKRLLNGGELPAPRRVPFG